MTSFEMKMITWGKHCRAFWWGFTHPFTPVQDRYIIPESHPTIAEILKRPPEKIKESWPEIQQALEDQLKAYHTQPDHLKIIALDIALHDYLQALIKQWEENHKLKAEISELKNSKKGCGIRGG